MKNIQNPNAYKKGYIDLLIFVVSRSLPQNDHVLPQMGFSQFSPKILIFFEKLVL